ncbi:MAG: FKBP-type peptidyl-prolyl cis-trans isomerase [Methanomicrobiales archaeon]|nr:FKBP-type peptidyl-prolyl cis-trans isomerase [Methanomicrobiales archaeon]
MTIKKGDFVRLNYTGEIEGRVFDTTDEAIAKENNIRNPEAVYGPFLVRVGSGHVISGLDEDLEGKEVGVDYTLQVPPEKGFGFRDEGLVESVSVAKFKETPELGTRVQVEGREGVVVNRIGRRVIVDFNHPFAGKTLEYRYRIEEQVDSPVEQIKGLIRLYAQKEMEVEVEGNTARITLSPGVVYDRRWLLWRGRIIDEILSFVDGIEHITLTEHFDRPKVKAGEEESAGKVAAGNE